MFQENIVWLRPHVFASWFDHNIFCNTKLELQPPEVITEVLTIETTWLLLIVPLEEKRGYVGLFPLTYLI